MPAAYEEILAFILAQLNDPVEQHETDDGAVVMTSGDPGEVIVRLSSAQVLVAEYAAEWQTPYEAAIEPVPIGSVNWSVISPEAAMRSIKALMGAAREARLSKYSTCTICEQRTAPEWMHSEDVCRPCAERDREVVH